MNMLEEEIFCMPVKDLFQLVQIFHFKKMTLAIKVHLVIVEDYANLFLACLNIHVFYEEEVVLTLPVSPNPLALRLSIPKPNNCIYD